MVHQILGFSNENRPIEAVKLTEGPKVFLLMGGVHGDEPEAFGFVEKYAREGAWRELELQASLWILPRLNPDGCDKGTRANARGVDLNRNMPTADWTAQAAEPRYQPGGGPASEVETQALIKFIGQIKPNLIISAHSWKPCINYNGACKRIAEVMSSFNKYEVNDYIGYPTPGSFGAWAALENGIPTITLEVREGAPDDEVWRLHNDAVTAAFLFAASTNSWDV